MGMVRDRPQPPRELLTKTIARQAQEWHDYIGCDTLDPCATHGEDEQRVYCGECRTVIARLPA